MTDLQQAIRLLHIVRAYTRTPGNQPDPARRDPLYPNGSNDVPFLWREIDKLLEKYPYKLPKEKKDADPTRSV